MTVQGSSCKVLWVAPRWPWPAQDGASIAIVNLIQGTQNAGGLDVVFAGFCGGPEQLPEEFKQYISRSYTLPLQRGTGFLDKLICRLKNVFSKPCLALTVAPYASSASRQELQKIIEHEQPAVIVYDGLHAAAHSQAAGTYVKPGAVKVIYRAHNREAQLWRRKQNLSRGLLKLVYAWQRSLIERFENSLIEQADLVCCVSAEDAQNFSGIGGRVEVVPIGMDFSKSVPIEIKTENSFLFVGRLDWPPNREGLTWFLKEVWPLVMAENQQNRLDIIGSGNIGDLEFARNLPGIKLHGRVEDLNPYYQQAHLVIVPLFYGSGTRVKVIEAASFSRSCISTAIGVEGLPLRAGQDYVRAETVEDWVRCCIRTTAMESQELGFSARSTLQADYSITACGQRMNSLIVNLLNRRTESYAA